jgi:hypothetical protein|tara:strand:- start:1212 stop:1472 length:261 start_codon:yes stop_codon:yes gene_type:complete
MGILFWALLRALIFSCIGNSFYKWFQKTKYGIWFDKRLDNILSRIIKNEDVARSKAVKPNDKQIEMFEDLPSPKPIPRRNDGGPSK